MRKILLIVILVLPFQGLCQSLGAFQDPQWTMLNINQLYKNPAFAGESGGHRFQSVNRWQWFNFKGFNSYSVSIDTPLFEKSGIGAQVNIDNQIKSFSQTSAYFFYSVQFPENTKIEKFALQLGLKAGFNQSRIGDFSKSIFADQLGTNGIDIIMNNSSDPLKTNDGITNSRFDSGIGMVFKFLDNKEHDYPLNTLGISVDHFQEIVFNNEYSSPRIGIQFSRHRDYSKKLFNRNRGDQMNLSPSQELSLNYFRQFGSSQLQIMKEYHSYPMHWGYGIRHDLFKTFKKKEIKESILLTLGYQFQKLVLNYSFDLTISSLSLKNTWGSHEVSLLYHFDSHLNLGGKIERRKKLKCWNFK